MLKVLTQFVKVIAMLTLLIILNPHRAVLIPFSLFAACSSWVAWKLEDLCEWIAKWVKVAKEKFWLFGKPLNKKLDEEMNELNRLVAEVDKRLKKEENDA